MKFPKIRFCMSLIPKRPRPGFDAFFQFFHTFSVTAGRARLSSARRETPSLQNGALRTVTPCRPHYLWLFILVVAGAYCATLERVSDVTRILEAAQQGDPTAADQLLPLV